MSEELKQAVDGLQSTWEEFKHVSAQRDTEITKLGETAAETKETIDRLQDQIDEFETRLQKIGLDDHPADGQSEQMKAFGMFLRKQAGPDELKALSVGDDTQGGFLAPEEFVREILKGVVEFSPLRQYARVRTTSATSIKVPKRTGTLAAQWVAEQGTRAETTGLTYGLEEIPTHELYALVDVSNQLVEDAVFNIESELQAEFAEQFGVAEGTAFVAGNGVGKPEGFLENASVAGTTSTTDNALNADDFATLLYTLKEPYHPRAAWLLNRLTVRDARLLKESTTNAYIWQPGLAGDVPATILGKPYVMATDMPVVANAAKAIAVGDWSRGYNIVDRIQMAVQRDPFTQATAGNIRFIARRRVGGQVVVPEAIKILVIK